MNNSIFSIIFLTLFSTYSFADCESHKTKLCEVMEEMKILEKNFKKNYKNISTYSSLQADVKKMINLIDESRTLLPKGIEQGSLKASAYNKKFDKLIAVIKDFENALLANDPKAAKKSIKAMVKVKKEGHNEFK